MVLASMSEANCLKGAGFRLSVKETMVSNKRDIEQWAGPEGLYLLLACPRTFWRHCYYLNHQAAQQMAKLLQQG